jgi:hypothetical protein
MPLQNAGQQKLKQRLLPIIFSQEQELGTGIFFLKDKPLSKKRGMYNDQYG